MRKLIWLLPIVTLLAGPVLWELPITNPLLVSPVVVVVGSTEPGSFGYDVAEAVKRSAKRLPEGTVRPEIELVSSPESPPFTADALKDLEKRILAKVSGNNVVAFISANVTDAARPCIEVGRRLRIPVFLTVATNDRLLAENNGTCLRLVPDDAKQAAVVARWARERMLANPGKPIALFWDQTSYATDLVRTLRENPLIGSYALLPFQLNTTTEMVGLIRYAKEADVCAWIFVGYPELSIDFLAKKRNLKVGGDVLFTDGCYGSWLREIPPGGEEVFLSFPKKNRAAETRPDARAIGGFGDYGNDALLMITKTLPEVSKRSLKRQAFVTAFLDVINDRQIEIPGMRNTYRFNTEGENEANDFDIYAISKSEIP